MDRVQRNKDIQFVFNSEKGEKVLAWLAKLCRYDQTVIGLTTEQTYLNEGKRQVYLEIQRVLNTNPNQVGDTNG